MQPKRPPAGALRRAFANYNWEIILVAILLAIHVMNGALSSFYKLEKLPDATITFLDKGFIALSMTFIILTGYIDISVASTVALSAVVMATSYNAGLPMPLAILLCLAVGTLCGMVNGLILVKFKELAPMIVTLGTQIIYRGIAQLILEDKASGKFPSWFAFLGWESIGGVPVMLLCFLICFALYAFVLHKTTYGRTLYAIGKNKVTSRFSGLAVDKAVFINYTLNGLMAAVTALFLTSRMGSTRPNVALAYEMDVIAMVVLGGVSTAGGRGRMGGVLIAIFIVGLIRYGLGLVNINTQILMIIIGALLILSVALPELKNRLDLFWHERRVRLAAQSK